MLFNALKKKTNTQVENLQEIEWDVWNAISRQRELGIVWSTNTGQCTMVQVKSQQQQQKVRYCPNSSLPLMLSIKKSHVHKTYTRTEF